MVALLHPNQPHATPPCDGSAELSATTSRPGIGSPPRSGSEARSRSGQRDRADLRLVIDNTVVDNTVQSPVDGSRGGFGERLHRLFTTPVQELWPTMSLAQGVTYPLGVVVAMALVPLAFVVALWGVGSIVVAADGGSPAVGGVSPASETLGREVVVVSGDTLWSIAGEIAPGADRRSVVAHLSEANGGVSELRIGQRLVVPSRYIGSEEAASAAD